MEGEGDTTRTDVHETQKVREIGERKKETRGMNEKIIDEDYGRKESWKKNSLTHSLIDSLTLSMSSDEEAWRPQTLLADAPGTHPSRQLFVHPTRCFPTLKTPGVATFRGAKHGKRVVLKSTQVTSSAAVFLGLSAIPTEGQTVHTTVI